MKAILIEPLKRSVREVKITNSLQDMYDLICCETVCTVPVKLPNRDMLFVDDEGLFNRNKGAFLIEGCPQPLSGNGLIIGQTRQGHSTSSLLTASQVESMITFIESDQLPEPKLSFFLL